MNDGTRYWTATKTTKNLFDSVGERVNVSYVGAGGMLWNGVWVFDGALADEGVYVLRDETDNKIRVIAASRVEISKLCTNINEVKCYE